MAKKQKKKKMPVPLLIVLCVCVAALGLSIWQLSDIFLEYKAGTDEYDDLQQYVMAEVPEDGEGTGDAGTEETGEDGTEEERVQRVALSELQAQNSDTVGWIEIPGTGISYPLMQTGDDSYYLNHTFSMFAGLKNYESPSYLVAHPTVYIDLADGTHAYQIFSVYESPSESDSYTIGFAPDEQYETFLQTLKSRSSYDTGVTVTKDDYIITLSTCTKSGEHRYLVHAKKVY